MKILNLLLLFLCVCKLTYGQDNFQRDTIMTDEGELVITFLGHGTLYFTFNKLVIHIDPVDRYADYSTLPKADLIFITHHHGDHLQPASIEKLVKGGTELVFTKKCAENYPGEGIVASNGDVLELKNLKIETVPAYNVVQKRDDGSPFHPKGEGNGYIFNFGNTRVYVAGDTENFPEMNQLNAIDIAFLPMNLPYTMTPEMVAEAVKLIQPKILYPYHYGETNINDLLSLMETIDYCEVRVRNMK